MLIDISTAPAGSDVPAVVQLDNRRTRILTEQEQIDLLAACPRKLARIVRLALITGARIGEVLALRWDDITSTEVLLLETKNGRSRRLPRRTD